MLVLIAMFFVYREKQKKQFKMGSFQMTNRAPDNRDNSETLIDMK